MKKAVQNDEFLKKRKERQRKIRRRRLKVFFFTFILLLLAVGTLLSVTVLFPIEKISSSGSLVYSAEQIENASGINKGDNLIITSQKKVEERIRKKLPYIASVELKRTLPNSIKIVVKDTKEYSCYSYNNKFYLVSKSGWVLKKLTESPTDVFTVYGAKVTCVVGEEIKYEDAAAQELSNNIHNALAEENITVNSIDVSNTVSITAEVESRFKVNFGTSNYLAEKIRHLGGMIEKISPEKSGEINLSMWEIDSPQGTFKAKNSE